MQAIGVGFELEGQQIIGFQLEFRDIVDILLPKGDRFSDICTIQREFQGLGVGFQLEGVKIIRFTAHYYGT